MPTSSRVDVVVYLDAPELGPLRPVGVLTRFPGDRPAVTFLYARSWLNDDGAFQLDPRLPLVDYAIQMGSGGIPPSLADTAPDSWGRLLLDRRAGRTLGDWELVTSVDDETRMGALRLRLGPDGPLLNDAEPAVPVTRDLKVLRAAARAIETDPDADIADADIALLVAPGSSLGGARPKANYRADDGSIWIAKFPSRTDRHDIGAWELAYNRLAAAAGIEVAPADVLDLGGSGQTFVTRRFDRSDTGGRRLYVSATTLTDQQDRPGAGYPDIARAMRREIDYRWLSDDLAQMYRRLLFNVVAGNRDDHLRNHGFLRTAQGWRLAPAFDMNPSRIGREHSLTLDGRTHGPDIGAAYRTHGLYGVSEVEAQMILSEVVAAVSTWPDVTGTLGIRAADRIAADSTFAALEPARTQITSAVIR